MSGPHKDDRRRYMFKRALMDCVYITAGEIIGWLRVDIDRQFSSIKDLKAKLQAKVDRGELPCVPHVISWIYDDRKPGVVPNPHLIWCLPPGRGVYAPKGEKLEELKTPKLCMPPAPISAMRTRSVSSSGPPRRLPWMTHKAIADMAGRCKKTVQTHSKVCLERAHKELAEEAGRTGEACFVDR